MWVLVFCTVVWLLVAARAIFWKPNPNAGQTRLLMLKMFRHEYLTRDEKAQAYKGCLKSWVVYIPWTLLSAVSPVVVVWGALNLHIGEPVFAYLAVAVWLLANLILLPFSQRTTRRLIEADTREEVFVAERLPLMATLFCHLPDLYAFYMLVLLLSRLSASSAM